MEHASNVRVSAAFRLWTRERITCSAYVDFGITVLKFTFIFLFRILFSSQVSFVCVCVFPIKKEKNEKSFVTKICSK